MQSPPLLEHRVGLRRAVARDDVERLIGAQTRIQYKQQVEKLRVDRLDDVDAKIAQQMIQIVERARDIVARRAIRGRQPLVRMRMEKRERSLGSHVRERVDRVRRSEGRRRNEGTRGGGCRYTEKRAPRQMAIGRTG